MVDAIAIHNCNRTLLTGRCAETDVNTKNLKEKLGLLRYGSFVALLHFIPVHHLPPIGNVVRTFILIAQVIGMFPNIEP